MLRLPAKVNLNVEHCDQHASSHDILKTTEDMRENPLNVVLFIFYVGCFES